MGGCPPSPGAKRLTWFYPNFGSYVAKEYVTPEQLAVRVRSIERQEAARAQRRPNASPDYGATESRPAGGPG